MYNQYKTTMQHILILDWDDTVMPTTYLLSNIEYDADPRTKRLKSFRVKPGSEQKEEEIRRHLNESGQAALRMLSSLYLYFVDNSAERNLLIVTNGATEWMQYSLTIAGSLCPVYRRIQQLLRKQNTRTIFARNRRVHPQYWKMAAFDEILDQFLEQKRCHRLNVVTIGDQWNDHHSIEMTPTFQRRQRAVSHHHIKLEPAVDARYLAIELRGISALVESVRTRCHLLRFASPSNAMAWEFKKHSENKGN